MTNNGFLYNSFLFDKSQSNSMHNAQEKIVSENVKISQELRKMTSWGFDKGSRCIVLNETSFFKQRIASTNLFQTSAHMHEEIKMVKRFYLNILYTEFAKCQNET